ncbi:response regulator transcription factor [Candidatus Sumerlaeota bacterium]|nr:response regulator transcription factor [Candidatus Sumerlaeota bacterium]
MELKKILIVEDDPDIASTVDYNLRQESYKTEIIQDGREVLDAAKTFKPDLILLDIMIPGLNGFEACKLLKNNEKTSSIPIIMVTVKSNEVDVVLGLELGAADYVTKPFSVRVLLARIRNVLRREDDKEKPPAIIHYHSLVIDREKREIHLDKRLIHFSKTEFEILTLLASKPGRVFSRNALLQNCWPDGVFVLDRTVDVHINSIRKKLGKSAGYIESIRGVGYRLKE